MDSAIIGFLILGVTLGIAAALSPGPLMALLVTETLRFGVKGGAKVAVSPLLTDVPFIVAALLLARGIESSPVLLGTLSLLGAGFLGFLAIQNLRATKSDFNMETGKEASLMKGVVVNLLNPHMYLYWFSIATPIFAKGNATQNSLFAAGLLLASVITMLGMSYGIARVRMHVFDHLHWMLRFLGLLLGIFSIRLLMQGLQFLT